MSLLSYTSEHDRNKQMCIFNCASHDHKYPKTNLSFKEHNVLLKQFLHCHKEMSDTYLSGTASLRDAERVTALYIPASPDLFSPTDDDKWT